MRLTLGFGSVYLSGRFILDGRGSGVDGHLASTEGILAFGMAFF